MAKDKNERLMNLVIALLSSRQFRPAAKIREIVDGYGECPNQEAFSRMFERDKAELRKLGVPLEVGMPIGFDVSEGYRIDPTRYALPEISLTGPEAAAVAIAARLWDSPELASAGASAIFKLRAAGVDAPVDMPVRLSPTSSLAAEPALGPLMRAAREGYRVRFEHRGADGVSTRTLDPWGVVTARRRWYVVGRDVDKEAVRTFRVGRISEVAAVPRAKAVAKPADVDVRELVLAATSAHREEGVARVWVAAERAGGLRRSGTVVLEGEELGGRIGDIVEIPVEGWAATARAIAEYGSAAIALEPAHLREKVVALLAAAASPEEALR